MLRKPHSPCPTCTIALLLPLSFPQSLKVGGLFRQKELMILIRLMALGLDTEIHEAHQCHDMSSHQGKILEKLDIKYRNKSSHLFPLLCLEPWDINLNMNVLRLWPLMISIWKFSDVMADYIERQDFPLPRSLLIVVRALDTVGI